MRRSVDAMDPCEARPPGQAVTQYDLAYTGSFYEEIEDLALRSAQEIAPLIINLVEPRSVIDIGCGTGGWLAAFKSLGVERVRGLDGDWVNQDRLLIAKEEFVPWNLETPPPAEGHFDLALCLEVAEHLPPNAGIRLVEFLTSLAPAVLFSAAIPGQGGVCHLNEQWPDYWIERFRIHGYVAADWLRPLIWNNEKIAWYYSQNSLLFLERGYSQGLASLHAVDRSGKGAGVPAHLVHPELWLHAISRCRRDEGRIRELEAWNRRLADLTPGAVSLKRVLRTLPFLIAHALRRRVVPIADQMFSE